MHETDFSVLANALGGRGITVENREALETAIKIALYQTFIRLLPVRYLVVVTME
jgi:thiamine pyrophosphate-dependent acetolactate synthase large subunit-like protein